MAKFCSESCEEAGSICDFCKWYDFNGNERGAYTGDGWCNKFNEPSDPHCGSNCDEFICRRVVEE
jgi:hypothetical protein